MSVTLILMFLVWPNRSVLLSSLKLFKFTSQPDQNFSEKKLPRLLQECKNKWVTKLVCSLGLSLQAPNWHRASGNKLSVKPSGKT